MSLLRWLISRLAPAAWRDSLLGDLDEERQRRLQRHQPTGAFWMAGAGITSAMALRWSAIGAIGKPSLRRLISGLVMDVRLSLRSLRASPGFTAVAILVMTLGLGLTTAIYSVVDAVLLRGLPYDDAGRLVAVGEVSTTRPPTVPSYVGSTSAPTFSDWSRHQSVFEGMGAAATGGGFVAREGGDPETLSAIRATASLFSVLRLRPALGSLFTADDEVEGRDRVVLIGDHFWRRRYGTDPNIVGQTLTVDAGTFRIIGVLPPGFTYPAQLARPVDVVAPYVVPPTQRERGNRGRNYTLWTVARLRDDVSVDQARAEIERITAGLARESPAWFKDQKSVVFRWHDTVTARTRGWMLLLLGAVGCVLLIACANLANLMLARGTARSRDLLVRSALGASRWRLARGLIVESLLLSGLGLAGALVAARWGVDVLRAAMPAGVPRLATIAIDGRVLAAAAALALATGLAASLAPAVQLSRPDLAGGIRSGARAGSDRRRERVRAGLVVAEVALACVLLVGAGLFVSSFANVAAVDLGLDPRNVIAAGVNPRLGPKVDDAALEGARQHTADALAQILARLRPMPQVQAVAAVSSGSPLSGSWRTNSITVPGKPTFTDAADPTQIREVTPGYLDVVRVPLRRGRYIVETDTAAAPLVVVLNDEAVRRYFDGRDPIGTTVTIDEKERLVVGVVGDVRLRGPEIPIMPEAYLPLAQTRSIGATVLVRTIADPGAFAPALKAAVLDAVPGVPVTPMSLETSLGTLTAARRFNMVMVGLFGVVAVTIAAVGIYGVMAFVVAQRTREIGVRMALGAAPGGVVGLVLAQAATLLGSGLAIGLATAWALAGTVESFLFGLGARDARVFAGVTVVLLFAGLVAAALPARRASRVDPLIALRSE